MSLGHADSAPVPSPAAGHREAYVSVDSQTPSPIDFQADALFTHVPTVADSRADAPAPIPSSSLPTHTTPFCRDTVPPSSLPSESTPLIPPPTQKRRWRRRLAIASEFICLFLSVLFSFALALALAGAALFFTGLFVRHIVPEIMRSLRWERIWDAIRTEGAIAAAAYAMLVTILVVAGFVGMFLLIHSSIIMILDAFKYAAVGAPRIARTRWRQIMRAE